MVVGLFGLMFLIRSRMAHRMLGWPRRATFAVCVALLGAAGTQIGYARAEPPRAEQQTASVSFDIQDQALPAAIERFSVVSGWQVIYDSSLAVGRRSTRLSGSLPPLAALRILLVGTGLKADLMAADGAVLTVGSQPAIPASERPSPPAQLRNYYGQIQSTLKRAFCGDERLRGGAYRIAVGIWIGSTGNVTRAEALGTTGSREIDAAFESGMSDVAFHAPPAGFDQPVVVLVTPDLLSQCGGTPIESAGR
jgi:hypothetical protein